ncbi:MAG: Gfo/Idh/MocA family oxidoreductase [Alphaproteobacteria bacterium]|nr:Gfo/Idh/MocA family oxidoreductase [Alphaproteobacteria bacterium]
MTTRLGFIGFGIMGERLLRAALDHDKHSITVTGVFDPGARTADRLASIDPGLEVFRSAREVIAASDCLHIASPPLSHLDYLRQCQAAGKAALCEKPLATDVVLATKVVEDLVANGMRAAVNFPFASSFAGDYLKTWLEDGVIGTPERVDIELAFATWPRSWQMAAVDWLDGRAEGGFTREVGSHFLFLSRRFFGPLQLLSATCGYPEPDRSERDVRVDLRAGDLPVSLSGGVGTTSKDDHNTWTITGSKGRIRLRDWSIAEQEVDGRWQAPSDALPNVKARPLILARQLDKVDAMTRGEAHNLASLSEALEIQRIVEQILKAA